MSFGRKAVLVIGDKEIRSDASLDLRIAFDVLRDKSRDPNDATIQVWGLSEATRAQFEEAARIPCDLSAGYADEGISRIFSGVLLDAVSVKEGADWVTTFSLGDDGPAKAALKRVQRRFGVGTPVATVLRELVKATGLGPGNTTIAARDARLGGGAQLTRPWTASGSALQALQSFSRSIGLSYSIQDGGVLFLGVAPALLGRGPVITGDNVQAPTLDANGAATFVCRLLPDLIPGMPLRLDTDRVKGDFAAISTQHFGDTHGADYSVKVTADPISRIMKEGLRVNA